MGGVLLSQHILEHVLQFADGETLLMCKEVSPEFAAAVKYLSKTKNIWEKCYSEEKGEKHPYFIISKLHPHNEGLNHPKNWGVIYETCLLGNFIRNKEPFYVSEFKIGTEYSDILDVETHEDLILILVKYNKEFSIFNKIITINLDNVIVDKSCRFFANMLYITPIEDPSNITRDAIILSCDLCQLVAVPVFVSGAAKGFPHFDRNDDFLTVEHSNGEYLWINNFGKLLTKGKCFHTGKNANHEEIKLKDSKSIKVSYQGFTSLFISCGETQRIFNTFKSLRASVTASLCYSNLLFVGTDTGMLYAYILNDESDLKELNLKAYIWNFDVCSDCILVINVMELKNKLVVVCCSKKSVYHIHIRRQLKNFT